ncbi:carboxylesterase/lipase family protein [Cryobacterium sp. MDB2-33-2]|uniref:carboxylesterase/lipase family protein n=1 Tax=Cryobacterium sp. MDB2-33-2 TaxID=1259179 RepID=UPI00106B0845|nr:carboxylesterase/lipase family protein [Cryobacterium sp. MDB2-33-2]TFC06218.1 carboxylesterase/lipase family protein [Cryobacterium sp. MDB2-33-2]
MSTAVTLDDEPHPGPGPGLGAPLRSVSIPRGRLDVRVSGGIVRGVHEDGILAWRGIPYAAPPVGDGRFRAPRPVESWAGIRDASRFGKIASQPHRGQFRAHGPRSASGEDCLTINVMRPAAGHPRRLGLPVMVFIHGGGYSVGSSQDFTGRGERFVRSGRVVYVSFNYRLGALGYIDFTRYSTPDHPIESNLGLRDQVAALRWVRDNIRAFGGNPNNVTVFGESAGGNAVITLMATPAAEGLFARAIAQSSPSNAAFSRELTDAWAAEVVEELRTLTEADAGAVGLAPDELLAMAPADVISQAVIAVQTRTPDSNPGTFCLVPVVDGDFLPERPVDAFRAGREHRVPLIIGSNEREGTLFRGRVDILPHSAPRISAIFDQAPESSHEAMRAVYAGLSPLRGSVDFGSDFVFWYPSLQLGELHSRVAPVYVYRFDLAPRLMHMLGFGATHGIELFALFDQTDLPVARIMSVLGGRELFINAGERMRRNWLHFALTGRPDADWPRFTEEDRLTLIIDAEDRVESDPRGDRRAVWQEFLPDW